MYDTSVAGSVWGAAPSNLPSQSEEWLVYLPRVPCEGLPSPWQRQLPPLHPLPPSQHPLLSSPIWLSSTFGLTHIPENTARAGKRITSLIFKKQKTPSGCIFKFKELWFKNIAQSPMQNDYNYVMFFTAKASI